MASRNGLNPKIRGLKGVGFGRALPATFGFGNGVRSTSGYFSIPKFSSGSFTQQPPFTIEFWSKCNIGINGGAFWTWVDMQKNTAPTVRHELDINGGGMGVASSDSSYRATGALNFTGAKQHLVWSSDNLGNSNVWFNGVFFGALPSQFTPYNPTTFNINFNSYVGDFDEFRYYNVALRPDQVGLNYNNGVGANPCVTEFLLAWYQFEKFEILDFSALQDGTDIRLGVRDMSGNNNHAEPVGMDTNPASGTYVLNPF